MKSAPQSAAPQHLHTAGTGLGSSAARPFPHGNPSPQSFPLILWKLCIPRPMWISRPPQPVALPAPGPAFHTNHSQSTWHFSRPVGDVGNLGPITWLPVRFSKSPEFHNHVLENRHTPQTRSRQPLRPVSHFSCRTTGMTVSLVLKTSRKALPVAPCAGQPRSQPCVLTASR